jgi:hypothetical protein
MNHLGRLSVYILNGSGSEILNLFGAGLSEDYSAASSRYINIKECYHVHNMKYY